MPAYFLQFLLAAGIVGGMWIFDRAKRQMLVKLYRAWKSKDKEQVEILTAELKKKVSEQGKSAKDKIISAADRFKDRFMKK